MVLSMFDQMLFDLKCKHQVVLRCVENQSSWTCEECGVATDLASEPYRTQLAQACDTADRIDKQARERGETIRRADL